MKNFWSKWFISASSGIFGKLFAIVLLGGGIVGSVFLLPEESTIVKSIVSLMPFIVGYGLSSVFINLPLFKEWSREARADRIREKELDNENLKLQLELREKNQHSPPDNEE